jgi:hypothetical protein
VAALAPVPEVLAKCYQGKGLGMGIPKKENPSWAEATHTGDWSPAILLIRDGEPNPCHAPLKHGWAEERAH